MKRITLIFCGGGCGDEILDIRENEKPLIDLLHANSWRMETHYIDGKPVKIPISLKCIAKRFYRHFKKDYKEDVYLIE